jgi:AcrR family transcriptional regulator
MPRPRSEAVRRAVLAAAIELLESRDHAQLTMEGIARRARVSKQTVYRWWASPADVLMEALNDRARAQVVESDTGSLARDLRAFVASTVRGLREGSAPLVATLMAKAQLDEEFGKTFGREFLARRRKALRTLFERAQKRGELAAGADLDLLVDIAFGTVWYRVLGRHGPLDDRFADRLADALLLLCSPA